MRQRLKSVIRIAQLIDHQKEVIEMQVLQIQQQFNNEKTLLADLENQLQDTIGNFENDIQNKSMMNSQDMAYLFGISSYLFTKIEQKNSQVVKIGKELKARKAILLEAYKKKKAFELFKNKMVVKETRDEALLEQKSLDYSNLVSRLRR